VSTKVLVTGAAGFIGSHLVERLAEEGFDVRAFVRYNARNDWGWLEALPRDLSKRIEVFRGDIKDSEAVHRAVADAEVVYHLAALISIPYSYVNPLDIVQTNTVGTANILNACLRSKSLKKLVATSTSEVYGTARSVPISEEHPLQAQSPYSASKIGSDKLCESYHKSFDLPVATIRPFNTYGPRQSMRAVIPSIIVQALSGKIVKVGSTSPERDFCYVADTVSGFRAVADSPESIGRVLNVGTGVGVTIEQVARKILKLMDSDADLVTQEERVRPDESEVMRLVCDSSEAQRWLKWRPKYSIDEGLATTISWFKVNASGYKPDLYNF
jgi:NAD dependent epimerase/dehydratase